jgi:hypothetical protein
MTLNLFEISTLPSHLSVHPKVSLLLGQLPGERELVESWAEGFNDRDGKFVNEFQSTFHSSLFELYLFALLKAQGMTVDLSRSRPDFLVTAPHPLVVEAVTSGIRADGRPEGERGFEDVMSMLTPPWRSDDFEEHLAESIVRYSNAICKKALKYRSSYSSLAWVPADAPYAIALGSFSQVNYGREYHYGIFALFFGLLFDAESRRYTPVKSISKPGTASPIDLNLFSREDFRHVSAVMFTCTLTLGKLTSMSISAGNASMNLVMLVRQDDEEPLFKMQFVSPESPEELFDGLFVLHNPNATNPLPNEVFEGTEAIHIRQFGNSHSFEGGNLPLVARLNLSRATVTPALMRDLAIEAFRDFNGLE